MVNNNIYKSLQTLYQNTISNLRAIQVEFLKECKEYDE